MGSRRQPSPTGLDVAALTRVLTGRIVLDEKGAWDALIWFGGLIMLAGQLDKAGLPKRLPTRPRRSRRAAGRGGWALVALLVVYLYAHYAFASLVAHVTAMFPRVLRRGHRPRRAAAPGRAGARILLQPQRGDDALRHRSGAHRVRRGLPAQAEWWRIGFSYRSSHVAIWLPIGFLWWKVIGLW